MAVYSRKSSGPVMRSLSPSGRFCGGSYAPSQSSSAFASSSSSFMSSRSATVFDHHHHHQSHRAASPTRVNLRGSSSAYAQSVRFSLSDRPISPNRSIAVAPKQSHHSHSHSQRKRTCLCSPTNHPGSFRCSFHKNAAASGAGSAPFAPNRLNARRSAMTNSLVRIGGVEGADLVKRALAALIRPSSHQQRRRGSFQRRPSRLSVMSKAEDS